MLLYLTLDLVYLTLDLVNKLTCREQASLVHTDL